MCREEWWIHVQVSFARECQFAVYLNEFSIKHSDASRGLRDLSATNVCAFLIDHFRKECCKNHFGSV